MTYNDEETESWVKLFVWEDEWASVVFAERKNFFRFVAPTVRNIFVSNIGSQKIMIAQTPTKTTFRSSFASKKRSIRISQAQKKQEKG